MNDMVVEADTDDAYGVVIVAHGLNNKPEVMDGLVSVLQAEGFHCWKVDLHRKPDKRAAPEDIINSWMNTLTNVHGEVAAKYGSLPIFGLGYSLGALATLNFLEVCPATLQRMVLIAPPVALTRGASLVRILTPLARWGTVLPSAAPRKYRARWGTPLSEYAAMLKLSDSMQTLSRKAKLRAIPTEILIVSDDELVSYAGVVDWLEHQELQSWTVHQVEGRALRRGAYAHMMVLEEALGRDTWLRMTDRIVQHYKAL